ncbi:MAG: AEC family transporter [Bifidobacteriaceae bacterium]|jgi:predicted permease|nr:AEC family transporter [Bifidobacteriaceae bacterium]
MLVGALLPIVVALGLGFLAGARHDFSAPQAAILNRMVMEYALPLSLFAGVIAVPRGRLFSNLPMLAWIAGGMVGSLAVVYVISRFAARRPAPVAALQALAIASPAVPFVGTSVLPDLFHAEAGLAVSIGSLMVNLVQAPFVMLVLTRAANGGPDQAPAKVGKQASAAAQLARDLRQTVMEPVVWAPLAAFVLVACGIGLPKILHGSLMLLGQATGGVALFASGATLFAQKVSVSKAVWLNVVSRNLAIPAAVWGLMVLAGAGAQPTALVVTTLAIPSGSIATILAIRFGVAAREVASTLFISTVGSALTMGLFLWLTHA